MVFHTPKALKLAWSLFPSANHHVQPSQVKFRGPTSETAAFDEQVEPRYDHETTSDAILVHVNLPHVPLQNISLTAEKSRIVITACRYDNWEDSDDDYSAFTEDFSDDEERSVESVNYFLEVVLGNNMDYAKTSTYWRDGDVLTVRIPLQKEIRSRTAKIKSEMFAALV